MPADRGLEGEVLILEHFMPQREDFTCSAGSIHAAFSRRASEHPDRIAVLCGKRTITYGELAAWSDGIAERLIGEGVRPGDIVGLYLDRTAEAIVAILGILKAGAAYLPF